MKTPLEYARDFFVSEAHARSLAKFIEDTLKECQGESAVLGLERHQNKVLNEELANLQKNLDRERELYKVLEEDNGRLRANLRRLQKELEEDRKSWNETTAQLEACRHDLGLAVKEASARDEKWKTGIEEVLGCKLDFTTLNAHNCASVALVKWAADQRRRCDRLDEALLQIEKMICAARLR